MPGIGQTKDVLELVLKAVKVLKECNADGKFDLADLPKAMAVIPNVFMALKGAAEVSIELKELDAQEAQELIGLLTQVVNEVITILKK